MGRRVALLVATYQYQDTGLRQLTAPAHDAQELAAVLQNPAIAGFEVTTLINEPHHRVGEAIGDFYLDRRRDDLTLLYFTGHGLKDDDGRLYLAMSNTRRDSLMFTALSAEQIDQAMERCMSRQKVLVLDCCYSGAFPAGRIAKADTAVHAIERFQGHGRTVLTASDATQYSFEGNQPHGHATQSVFTRHMVAGLRDGSADLDGDGDITIDEVYRYVHDRVVEEMPQQRPKKQDNVEGRTVIAKNINWTLPAYLRNAIASPIASDRNAALEGLIHLYRIGNDTVRGQVLQEIRRLADDDSKLVSAAAIESLRSILPAPPEPVSHQSPDRMSDASKPTTTTTPAVIAPAPAPVPERTRPVPDAAAPPETTPTVHSEGDRPQATPQHQKKRPVQVGDHSTNSTLKDTEQPAKPSSTISAELYTASPDASVDSPTSHPAESPPAGHQRATGEDATEEHSAPENYPIPSPPDTEQSGKSVSQVALALPNHRRRVIAAAASALAVIGIAVLSWSLSSQGKSAGSNPLHTGSGSSEAVASLADGRLTIGTLLPRTGSLTFLGPAEFAGVKLAVKEINDAGGVLGQPVTKIDTDSGDTTTDISSQSVNKLLQEKSDAIIGAASSTVSMAVIDKITQAGVIQISPANTSDEFTTYDDHGLYFRTAPSDALQGVVLGNLILSDSNHTLGILAGEDSYSSGMADNVEKTVMNGGGQVLAKVSYDPEASNYSANVAKIKAANPKAIALIGFDETKKIIPELVKQGLTADKYKWYFVDGNLSFYGTGKDGFPSGTLNGAKGTLPGSKSPDEFNTRMLGVDPTLEDFSYGPESYDAAILTALAAAEAKSDVGRDIAAHLKDVSEGGEECKDFKSCNDLLTAGKDIDYDGISGPIEFNDAGDPSEATFGICQYGVDNTYKNIAYNKGRIPS